MMSIILITVTVTPYFPTSLPETKEPKSERRKGPRLPFYSFSQPPNLQPPTSQSPNLPNVAYLSEHLALVHSIAKLVLAPA